MNYARFLTNVARSREPTIIRHLMDRLLIKPRPEMIFLAGGLPNPRLFPFKEASVTLWDGRQVLLQDNVMNDCLQYGPSNGYPPLVEELRSFIHRFHNPPKFKEMDLIVTVGSQDGLCKALEMMVNPGDFVAIQEPCFSGMISILAPLHPRFLPIEGDAGGMKPESLLQALKSWNPAEARDAEHDVPKVLCINPNACNPTGISIKSERRQKIYDIASEYNLIIIEDDPYYFMQNGSPKDFAPSFLSLDVDGRVIRLDSFSKVMSSGLRLGFVSGPKELVHRFMLHGQVSVLHPSSLSQVLVYELLKLWGEEGLLNHVKEVHTFYVSQRDSMLQSARKHLTGLCEWNDPDGGMFLWFNVPELEDTWDMLLTSAIDKGVALVPGRAFMTDPTKPCSYMRAAFSVNTPENMDKGLQRLAAVIRKQISLQAKKRTLKNS